MTNLFSCSSNIKLPDYTANRYMVRRGSSSVETTVTEYCDSCGAELDPEDYPIHLCKICQAM